MNVEGRLGASFLASFGNAVGRRRDTDKLICLNGIDRYRWGGQRERQDQKVDVKKKVIWLLIQRVFVKNLLN